MGKAWLIADFVLSTLLIGSAKNIKPQSATPTINKSATGKHSSFENKPVSLGGRFYLERSPDSFGIRSHGVIEKTNFGPNDSGTLYLATHGGYALFRKGDVQRYRFERSTTGKDVSSRIDRFPSPPSIQ